MKNQALVNLCFLQPLCSENLVFAVPGGPEWDPKSVENVIANQVSQKSIIFPPRDTLGEAKVAP